MTTTTPKTPGKYDQWVTTGTAAGNAGPTLDDDFAAANEYLNGMIDSGRFGVDGFGLVQIFDGGHYPPVDTPLALRAALWRADKGAQCDPALAEKVLAIAKQRAIEFDAARFFVAHFRAPARKRWAVPAVDLTR